MWEQASPAHFAYLLGPPMLLVSTTYCSVSTLTGRFALAPCILHVFCYTYQSVCTRHTPPCCMPPPMGLPRCRGRLPEGAGGAAQHVPYQEDSAELKNWNYSGLLHSQSGRSVLWTRPGTRRPIGRGRHSSQEEGALAASSSAAVKATPPTDRPELPPGLDSAS